MCCGTVVGTTPCEVGVDMEHRVLELQLDGHQCRVVTLPAVENPWVIGNVLTLGLGMLVDDTLGTARVPCTAPLTVPLHPGTGRGTVIRLCPDRATQGEPFFNRGAPQPQNTAETIMLVAYCAARAFVR